MQSRNGGFYFDAQFNFGDETPLVFNNINGSSIPENSMLYADGTPMLYTDGSFMLYAGD